MVSVGAVIRSGADVKIAITGAAGFVGSHLTQAFLNGGHRVLALDLARQPGPRLVGPAVYEREFSYASADVGADIERDCKLQGQLGGFQPDAIYHLAGIADPAIYVTDPQKVIDLNIDSMRNVIEVAKDLDSHPRIVFSSTSEVYGKNTAVPFREDADCVFGETRKTRWCYAQSKAVAEMLLRASGLDYTIFRFFNFVGSGIDRVGSGRVLTKMVGDALEHGEIRVIGDGSQTRCFTLIDDALSGLMAPALDGRGLNMTLNIGSDEEMSVSRLAQVVRNSVDVPTTVRLVDPAVQGLGEGYEDMQRRVPDLTAVREELGWAPSARAEEFLPGLVRAMVEDVLRWD